MPGAWWGKIAGRIEPFLIISIVLLAACGSEENGQALGTLEWDRIELVATAAESIVSVDVHEGQWVKKGDRLLQLNPAKEMARLKRFEASRHEAEARLAELVEGPRKEEIAQARARVEGARSRLREAEVTLQRTRTLKSQDLTSESRLDLAITAFESTEAQLEADREALAKLLAGTRVEQIVQAEYALEQAQASVARQQVVVSELTVVATRDGRLDNLPYKLGERPFVGATLAVILAGPAPYARVYVSEPDRLGVQVGQLLPIHIDGLPLPLTGRVRKLSSDPVFTPYFALSERDRGRLAYVAEVILPAGEGIDLPAGVPVQVDLVRAEVSD